MNADEKSRTIEKMREKLAQCGRRIEDFKQRLTQARADRRMAQAAPLKAMMDEHESARRQVGRLQRVADDAWDDAVAGLKDTWGRFETAAEKAHGSGR